MKPEDWRMGFRERVENDVLKIETTVKKAVKPFTTQSTTHKVENFTINFKSLTINLESF